MRRAPWKQIPRHDRIPSGRLLVRVIRDGSHKVSVGYNSYFYEPNADQLSDRMRNPLEHQVREIAHAIKKGVEKVSDARERKEQQRAETQAPYERQKVEERQTRESILRRSHDKAILELRDATLTRAFQDWEPAEELRAFAACPEADATQQRLLETRARLRQWLQWGRDRADEIYPLKNLTKLDDGVFDAEPPLTSSVPTWRDGIQAHFIRTTAPPT